MTNRTLRHGVLAILGQHSRINAEQAARMAGPDHTGMNADAMFGDPGPPRQFADLDRLARYQATRRAFFPSEDAARIGSRLALECGGDMDAVRAKIASFAAAIEQVAQNEIRRDLAQDVRGAGL
jgi:hypothetical protein